MMPRHTLPLFLFALLLTPASLAMVVEVGVISGLPPNTVVELDLGLNEPATAKSNSDGEVSITDDEDDDDSTLYIPFGSDGRWTLRDARTGTALGDLNIQGASITVASLGSATQGMGTLAGRWDARGFLHASASMIYLDDIKTNTENGAGLARADGFTVQSSADDDALGWSVGVGFAISNDKDWFSMGSDQWQFGLTYSRYDKIEGRFTASQPGGTLESSGKQDIDSWRVSIGYEYFVADGFGLNLNLGYDFYDTEDSGKIVFAETGQVLGFFDESDSDETVSIGVGLSYYFCDTTAIRASYRYSFDKVGSSQSDEPSLFELGVIYTY
ncbi:MAG: outer membrane beta-barrel protein [Haliea sp.]|uniref:outer membrane beta-barrel protein n=1 Tax=Haliea sp. TaxID=1932666 RepID=UPI0032EFB7FE